MLLSHIVENNYMHAPLLSTLTLIAELFVSAIIYYSFYKGYKHGKFPVRLAGAAVLYEIIFNISYMASRMGSQTQSKLLPPFVVVFAIVHGTLSLIMFLALVVYFTLAWRRYRRGINYFHTHKAPTTVFLFFWTVSILSGIAFYLMDYVLM